MEAGRHFLVIEPTKCGITSDWERFLPLFGHLFLNVTLQTATEKSPLGILTFVWLLGEN